MVDKKLYKEENTYPKLQRIEITSQFPERENTDTIFSYIPKIAYLLNLGFFVITAFLFNRIKEENVSKILFLLISPALLTLLLLLIIPLYLVFWYMFKNFLVSIFLLVVFFPPVILFLGGLADDIPELINVAIGMFIAEIAYFWCLKRSIKIALITIKTAIFQINKNFRKSVKQISKNILPFLFFGSFTGISITMAILIWNLGTADWLFTNLGNVWKIMAFFSIFNWVYMLEKTAAVSYIYGAALFDQASLIADVSEEKLKMDEVFNRARFIALECSYGTACFGALIITIFRLFIANRKDEDDQTIMTLCLGAIGKLIEHLTAQSYVYSALYGKGLIESGKFAFESFKSSGNRKLLNFVIVDRILNIMCLAFTFIVGTLILVTLLSIEDEGGGEKRGTMPLLVSITSIAVIFQIFYVVNSIIGGSAACQIALYVEDPARFKNTHRRSNKLIKVLEQNKKY